VNGGVSNLESWRWRLRVRVWGVGAGRADWTGLVWLLPNLLSMFPVPKRRRQRERDMCKGKSEAE
jgi:hypothetical protein